MNQKADIPDHPSIGLTFRARRDDGLFQDIAQSSYGYFRRGELGVVKKVLLGSDPTEDILGESFVLEISGTEFVLFGADICFDFYFEKLSPLERLAQCMEDQNDR